jgi:peptidoglycan/LPS O-acetylase OafA/YrhL
VGYIRFILAVAVIIHHFPGVYSVMNGGFAVELFFVVSGFYMALVQDGKYGGNYWLFISNRLIRLMPVYYLAISAQLVILLGFGILQDMEASAWKQDILRLDWRSFWIFFVNALPLGQELASFSQHPLARDGADAWRYLLAPQSWSISMELVFYLVVPFLSKRIALIMFLALSSLLLRLYFVNAELDASTWIRRFIPSIFHFFLYGMLAYYLSKPYKAWLEARSSWFVIILIMLCLAGGLVFRSPSHYAYTVGYPVVSAIFAFCLPFFFYGLSGRMDALLGQLSYPIYMIHILVISAVLSIGMAGYTGLVLAVVVSVALAYAAYRWIELPLDAYRQSRVRGK